MRAFGQLGVKVCERELAENIEEARDLLTLLQLRGDPEGRTMARYLQWVLLKAETRERRGALFRF